MTAVIETRQLTKMYGNSRGIIDLDLDVHQGEVFGLLGPNGAGKSTTIRLLLDFIRPTSGTATILGLNSQLDSEKVHRSVGYLSGDYVTYSNMNGNQILDLTESLWGVKEPGYRKELIERFQMDPTRPVRTLSKGNRQKVGLVQSLMRKPALLIMDEPTSGLDPLMQQVFNETVHEAQEEGRTAFVSSHILPEVEEICERVGIIREGRLVTIENVRDLKAKAVRQFEVQFKSAAPVAELSKVEGIQDLKQDGETVRFTAVGELTPAVRAIARHEIVTMTCEIPHLDEVFLAYYKTGGDDDFGIQ